MLEKTNLIIKRWLGYHNPFRKFYMQKKLTILRGTKMRIACDCIEMRLHYTHISHATSRDEIKTKNHEENSTNAKSIKVNWDNSEIRCKTEEKVNTHISSKYEYINDVSARHDSAVRATTAFQPDRSQSDATQPNQQDSTFKTTKKPPMTSSERFRAYSERKTRKSAMQSNIVSDKC